MPGKEKYDYTDRMVLVGKTGTRRLFSVIKRSV